MSKQRLALSDHRILDRLIKGSTIKEIAMLKRINTKTLQARITRIKIFMECRTVYQLVALVVVNLMCLEDET